MGKRSVSLATKMQRARETSQRPNRMPCVDGDGTVQEYSAELVAVIDILSDSAVGLTHAQIQERLEAHTATRGRYRRNDSPGHYIYQGKLHSGREAAMKAGVVGPPIIAETGQGATKVALLTEEGRRYAKSAEFKKQLREFTGVSVQQRSAKQIKSRQPARRTSPTRGVADASAIEGIKTEIVQIKSQRSRKLRNAAFEAANGICCVCGRDYSKLLDGRGVRVLQVHHREQLSQRKLPSITKQDDLAVVCANCHLLLHLDPKKALNVDELKELLRSDGFIK